MAAGDRLRTWWLELGLQLPEASVSSAGRPGSVLGSGTSWRLDHGVQILALWLLGWVTCVRRFACLGGSFLILNFRLCEFGARNLSVVSESCYYCRCLGPVLAQVANTRSASPAVTLGDNVVPPQYHRQLEKPS